MEDQFLEEVKKRKDEGQSERQMATELNVSRSKVRTALQDLKLSESGNALVPENKLRAIIREELDRGRATDEEEAKTSSEFPIIRKMGGGMEMIAPEAVLKHYMGGTPEGEVELRAIMKFRAAMLMVMDLVNIQKGSAEADAKRMEPILRLMKETREEQDAAASRAKASTEEIAERTAQATAGQLFGAISQNNGQVNSTLAQIKQMVGGQSNDPFSQVVSMLQSMQQMSQMFGMPLPGMMPGTAPAGGQPGGQAPSDPPPIEKHTAKEWEERNV
ncbi:hypothetical protein C1G87_1628 [Dehalococcoides mccartyi]|uniref:Uncharacterized protein n=1 Tax=Dehalococcoides mccartyi TaxID=61435 RepID=A0A328EMN3_9CHLR|nr:hypothetical protein C1G87_1628 [Dehalococcoides mccartyi]